MPRSPNHTAAIIGVTGYVGQVLHALLMQHPCIRPFVPDVRDPGDASESELAALARHDVVLLAVPEEAAVAWVTVLERHGAARVLDLSGAHRSHDSVHYGIPELFGAPAASAQLVANPGCYPTATLLALRPLLEAELIEPEGIAVVGASGASGAGKAMQPHLQFCELHDNVFPYKVGEHRHAPEIERHLGARINFVTQLLPIVRGILLTAFVRPRVSAQILRKALEHHYARAPYVSVLERPDASLGLRHVLGTHQALLAVGPVERSGSLPIFASIDNLMRGAASQAVHNLNLWLELDPSAGLPPPLAHAPIGAPGMTRLVP